MTPDQMAELAARLHKQAQIHRQHFKTADQREWAYTIDTAADLIESMAQRVPLSEEQIMDLVRDDCGVMRWPSTVLDIARAVEQAHGIRSEE